MFAPPRGGAARVRGIRKRLNKNALTESVYLVRINDRELAHARFVQLWAQKIEMLRTDATNPDAEYLEEIARIEMELAKITIQLQDINAHISAYKKHGQNPKKRRKNKK